MEFWLVVNLFVLVPIGVEYYFNNKKLSEPTIAERKVANLWVWIRRFVCFVGAIFFLASAVIMERHKNLVFWKEIGFRVLLVYGAIFCVWVGINGRKSQTSTFGEDVVYHKNNKQRYKWPW